jgi:deoxyadenosine/deoxycytidine kinase
MTNTQRRMVLLEGNIGAGKTTIGRRVAASGAFSFVEEPTRIWQERYDVNMLDLFYSDTERWAFTFQINAFVTRAKTWNARSIAIATYSRRIAT